LQAEKLADFDLMVVAIRPGGDWTILRAHQAAGQLVLSLPVGCLERAIAVVGHFTATPGAYHLQAEAPMANSLR